MPKKKSGAMLLQQWLKKEIIRPGTRVRVFKAEDGLWPVPITATVVEVDTEGTPPIGFKPDDPAIECGGEKGLWWAKYWWLEILRPEDDPLNTQEVIPSQEVMTE